jgi:hypothetical protein
MEYELVICAAFDSDESIDDFIKSVNEKLAAGWKLQGGIACYPIPECRECIFFAQAIIRDKKDENCLTASEVAASWDLGIRNREEDDA